MQRRKPNRPGPLCWSRDEIENRPNKAVPAFLTASYIYYLKSDLRPIMSDTDFDWLCSYLLRRWRSVKHPHKHLITLDMLRAGTAYSLREAHYPLIVRHTAVMMSTGEMSRRINVPEKDSTRRAVPPKTRRKVQKGFLR